MKSLKLLAVTASVILGGCTANGMSRFQSPPDLDPGNIVITDDTIGKLLDAKPQLSPGFRLGVYFRDQSPKWEPVMEDGEGWNQNDKQEIVEALQKWEDDGIASDVFVISDALVHGNKLMDLRQSAAWHGADALMIIEGTWNHHYETNALGVTYPLLVTAYTVPATSTECRYLAHAGIWDVRNEFLYASVEVEGSYRQKHPGLISRTNRTLNLARHNAAEKLAENISQTEFHKDFMEYSAGF